MCLYGLHEFILQVSGNEHVIGRNAKLPAILFLPGERLTPLRVAEAREGNARPENSLRRQVDIGVVRDHNR